MPCTWPGETPLYRAYHDEEWGVPLTDGRDLFAKLLLDGFQAGLAWITILRKRDGFYDAFEGFDPERLAGYGDDDVARLMGDARIVRNRAKINAAITNAQAWLDIEAAGDGAFAELLWSTVDGKMLVNQHGALREIQAETDESRAMSKALRARGFKFVGPTICYAFIQAVGMVNDHVLDCPRHVECQGLARGVGRL